MKQEAVADLKVFRRVSDSTQLTAYRRPKKEEEKVTASRKSYYNTLCITRGDFITHTTSRQ